MGLVVGAFQLAGQLELHRAHLAAVIHVVEHLTEPVERFVGPDLRGQSQVGDGVALFGWREQGAETTLAVHRKYERRGASAAVSQRDGDGAVVFGRRA